MRRDGRDSDREREKMMAIILKRVGDVPEGQMSR